MATPKLQAVESGETKRRAATKRAPVKIAVTFDMVEGRLVVRKVYRDLMQFADDLTNDPTSIPLFAKIEVPFQS